MTHLPRRFPALAPTLCRRLAGCLSALAWWCPALADAPWLASFAFPFVHLFGADDCAAFEAVAAVLMNVVPGWMEHFPEPPARVIALGEQAIAQEDPQLARHLDASLGGAGRAVWHLMSTAFSDALPAADWAAAWDQLICGPPGMAPCLAAAVLLRMRNALLSIHTPEAADVMLRAPCGLAVEPVLEAARDMAALRSRAHRSWEKVPVALGTGATYPQLAPVPSSAVAAAAKQVALRQAWERQAAVAREVATRGDGIAAMQSVWVAEHRSLMAIRRQQDEERQALDDALVARRAMAQTAEVEARRVALDQRADAMRQQLLRERAAWHESLLRGANQLDARRAELDAQDAAVTAHPRLAMLEAEAEARAAAADEAAAHQAARQRVASHAAAAAGAHRLRGARFVGPATEAADDAARIARRMQPQVLAGAANGRQGHTGLEARLARAQRELARAAHEAAAAERAAAALRALAAANVRKGEAGARAQRPWEVSPTWT